MLDIVKRFFSKVSTEVSKDESQKTEHDVRIATCALFLEMARIDETFTPAEMDTILSIMKEKYGAKRSSSLHFRFGPGTAGSALTAQQPENNIIRTAYAALSAVLGGAHSLNVSSFDEALAIPTEKSARIALSTTSGIPVS